MKHISYGLHCVIMWSLLLDSSGYTLKAADAVHPLHTVRVSGAVSEVDEASNSDAAAWVISHTTGLKVVNLVAGTELDIMTIQEENRLGRGLNRGSVSRDGRFFRERHLVVDAVAEPAHCSAS